MVKLQSKWGRPMIIWGCVSVTTTLPFGTVEDVKAAVRRSFELAGPGRGFALASTSSIMPEVPDENIDALFGYGRSFGRRFLREAVAWSCFPGARTDQTASRKFCTRRPSMANDIKVAFVGVHRASSFFKAFQIHPDTQVVALCDINERTLADVGHATGVTQLYTIFERMLDEAQPDAVVIATPMQFHVPQSIAALQRGIHVLSEVTAAVSIDEARWLVQECNKSPAIYMMAENYNYRRSNVLVRAMVEAGVFGEVYYAEGEYLHELSILHHTAEGQPTWRYYWQVGVNGCTYPTHSLGPCLQWIKERPEWISCIGTGRWTDPEHTTEDTVLLLCKTGSEKLIRVRVDMLSKRPHSMINYSLQGTKGVYESARRPGEGNWVWLEDYCDDPNEWVRLETFEDEFLPDIWRDPPREALEAGHGGGDYFEVMDFVAAVQGQRPPAIDIHDAMDMTLPGLVSQESIRLGGAWLEVPDSRDW
jgi:predicted dehydrogenase